MVWDACAAWILLATTLAGFLNWCQYRTVWLAVQQFAPSFVWLAAWLLLIRHCPRYYKRNRMLLVLLMRCGMLMSEARAAKDGGDAMHLNSILPGSPQLSLLLQMLSTGLVLHTCLEVTAVQLPFAFQIGHILLKLLFACYYKRAEQLLQLARQPQTEQAAKQLLSGWLRFWNQAGWSAVLQHASIISRSCSTTLLFVVVNVTIAALLLWLCYLFSLADVLLWLRQKEDLALSEAAASDARDSSNPSHASIAIGGVRVTVQQLADAQDSAFITALLTGHPSMPVVTLVAHIVIFGCICVGSCMLSQLLVLQLLPRFASAATLDLYCPRLS
uniref:Uncharacterized protein n=1 Tax=Tetradesmus obliquus TaxID=3088 RepID=A0A383V603_TETOB|eukprot:jgi/Sobl393_1/16096/SZX60521.1